MRFRIFLAIAALMLSASVAARADDLYTITIGGYGSTYDGTFTFDTPSILTSDTTIPSADLTVLSGPVLDNIYVSPTSPVCPLETLSAYSSCVELNYASGDELAIYIPQQLTELGAYGNAGTLSVSIEPAPTPEPSSIALLGTGLLGFAGALRRRFVA